MLRERIAPAVSVALPHGRPLHVTAGVRGPRGGVRELDRLAHRYLAVHHAARGEEPASATTPHAPRTDFHGLHAVKDQVHMCSTSNPQRFALPRHEPLRRSRRDRGQTSARKASFLHQYSDRYMHVCWELMERACVARPQAVDGCRRSTCARRANACLDHPRRHALPYPSTRKIPWLAGAAAAVPPSSFPDICERKARSTKPTIARE